MLFQLYNGSEDVFFLDTSTSKATWEAADIALIQFITHITDSSDRYYENALTKEVTWVSSS